MPVNKTVDPNRALVCSKPR